eukprot:3611873-Ditylum_brightwellii.AAC.2
MAKLLTKIDPKLYQQYLRSKNGKSIMYAQLKKALYGTIKVALDEDNRAIKNKYGKEAPLTVNRGKVHNHLGMTLDFSSPKKELPDDFDWEVTTPAANHFFKVDKNAKKLSNQEADLFHHIMA